MSPWFGLCRRQQQGTFHQRTTEHRSCDRWRNQTCSRLFRSLDGFGTISAGTKLWKWTTLCSLYCSLSHLSLVDLIPHVPVCH
ncbi:unnamed protein product [Pleuronectes platessa]|uniref:Uncharacterized protein n=1 Tax=Pleuronectes platessa TaxID=8262 RepID=A0A9N7VRM0_PLEPL|nr:unnamed protein product [Pleuronectes platessa]